MKLYFKDGVTIATTVMILILIGYIAFCILTRKQTQHWGQGRLSSQVQHFLDKNSRGER